MFIGSNDYKDLFAGHQYCFLRLFPLQLYLIAYISNTNFL